MKPAMNHYEKLDWEYSQEDMLEFDQETLNSTKGKLNKRSTHFFMKERYDKEIVHLTESIRLRVELLAPNAI